MAEAESQVTDELTQEEQQPPTHQGNEDHTFVEAIAAKKLRAAKFGEQYQPTSDEKKRLREIRFGKITTKTGKNLKGTKTKQGKKRRRKKQQINVGLLENVMVYNDQVNLEDPDVQRRLKKFGTGAEGSNLHSAVMAAQDEEKIEERKQRFAISEEASSSA